MVTFPPIEFCIASAGAEQNDGARVLRATISRGAGQHRQDTTKLEIWNGSRHDRERRRRLDLGVHLIASGLVGEPTAPVIGIAGATNMNS
jgi:hypothetical protein